MVQAEGFFSGLKRAEPCTARRSGIYCQLIGAQNGNIIDQENGFVNGAQEHSGVNGCPQSHGLIGVYAMVGLPAQELPGQFPYGRHPGSSAHQEHPVNLLWLQPGISQGLARGGDCLL